MCKITEIWNLITVVWYEWLWETLISRKSYKIYESAIKSAKFLLPFTLSKAIQWIGVCTGPILAPV